jgi:hypothetical protein
MLIGIAGKAGAGKDTIAERLCEKWGYTNVKFAEAVWQAILRIDPYVVEEHTVVAAPSLRDSVPILSDVNNWKEQKVVQVARLSEVVLRIGREKAKAIPEVRRLLQATGNDMGREYLDPDLWVTKLWADTADMDRDGLVVSDVRYPNEADWCHRFGSVIKVERPGERLTGDLAQAKSETMVDSIEADVTISNDGTIEDLYAKIDELVVPER